MEWTYIAGSSENPCLHLLLYSQKCSYWEGKLYDPPYRQGPWQSFSKLYSNENTPNWSKTALKINLFFGGGSSLDLSVGYIFKEVPAYGDSHLCPMLSTIFYFHVWVCISSNMKLFNSAKHRKESENNWVVMTSNQREDANMCYHDIFSVFIKIKKKNTKLLNLSGFACLFM